MRPLEDAIDGQAAAIATVATVTSPRWQCARARHADAAVHLCGLSFATAAATLLLGRPGVDGSPLLQSYAIAPALLFLASSLFHHGPAGWRRATVRIDHAMIYFMIASTYSALIAISDVTPGMTLPTLWAITIAAAGLRLLGPRRMRVTSLSLYLIVAVGGLAIAWPALVALPPDAYRLVMLGGAFYLVGLIFHIADRLPFQQALWHGCVLAATVAIFGVVLQGVTVLA